MKFTALIAAAAATTGLAAAGELTPIPAPTAPSFGPAPVYQPAPAYTPSPSYTPSPTYAPAPSYTPAPAPLYAPASQTSHYGPSYGPVAGPPVLPGPRVPVRYKDLKNIAPCAVPQTVCVNGECGVQYVDICAPEGCVDVKRKRNKTVFDYGEYQVEIHNKRDGLVVDYDD